jgi:hypothetical protein
MTRWPMLFVIIFSVNLQNLNAEDSLDIESQYLEKRYQDFLIHQNEKRRLETEKSQAARDQKIYRNNLEKEKEVQRKIFVKERTIQLQNKSENSNAEKIYLEELKKREQNLDLEREKFVNSKKSLRKLKENSKMIPEDKEVGL